MPTRAPLVFGIGLPHSGGRALAALFEANGHVWQHHKAGKLAQNIAYAGATGGMPLLPWPKAVGFSGLYSMHKRHMPHLRVQDQLAHLLAAFPQAYFIRTQRPDPEWIAARTYADNGDHRAAAAWHAGLAEADLAQFWRTEQRDHSAACADLFRNTDRFLDITMTAASLKTLCDFVSADFDLRIPDDLQKALTPITDIAPIDTPRPMPAAPLDRGFVRSVAAFCRQTRGPKGGTKALSRIAITWTGANTFTTRLGNTAPLARAGDRFLMPPDAPQCERATATLNELHAHGAKPPLHIDMMDARFIGSEGYRTAPRKTLAYNRRIGARNITLWPLAAYHSLAPQGHPGGFAVDTIRFEDKTDRCVWMGNMTGRMSAVLTPNGRPLRGVYTIRDRAIAAGSDPEKWADIIADLDCVPRYNLVKTYRDHPDFDVGLVLRAQWKELANTPAFAGLCTPFRARAWFHQFRYILSLSGNDTGSNFLSAASSNALILKEEDGWELFYTDTFKPWVHYVPLCEGALDLVEKLGWARRNPAACRDMADAATALYDRFASPANRTAILRAIAKGLNALD